MHKIHLYVTRIVYFSFLAWMHFAECWTVKIVNLADEKITVNIYSSQLYVGWQGGPVKSGCEFVGKQVDPHAWRDFNYKDVNPACIAPCTKSVSITSPIKLSARNPLTSCSDVIAIVRKDASNKWSIEYHDWVAAIIKMLEERTRMPVGVRNIYDKFGNSPIQAISVFRQPIMSGIRELMKIMTKNELRHLHYDDLYHTGFIIKCQDQLIRLERNQTVSSDIQLIPPGSKKELELRDLVLSKTIRYDEFIDNAMEDDPNFWRYHPVNNNCQLFVLQCLEKNNISISRDVRAFIYQDAEKILKNNPLLKNIAISATSLANRIDNILGGTKEPSEIDQMIARGEIVEMAKDVRS